MYECIVSLIVCLNCYSNTFPAAQRFFLIFSKDCDKSNIDRLKNNVNKLRPRVETNEVHEIIACQRPNNHLTS